ncbi:hypothetical protein HMPREF0484_3251 [Klebsiella pneumoniae subsp. rhinoscleromatis ATCC 13884]|nr:hypothetical protein HMPREF0484_3251 [Klebsiella pneumoniae subsp. rhinoscleromatis ATCC 13884]
MLINQEQINCASVSRAAYAGAAGAAPTFILPICAILTEISRHAFVSIILPLQIGA